jgi:hypothetical protein
VVPAMSALLPTLAPLRPPTLVPEILLTPPTPRPHLAERNYPSHLLIQSETDPHFLCSSTKSPTPSSSTSTSSGGSGGAVGLTLSSFGVAGVIGAIAALF